MKKNAIITGINGQDGTLLADHLVRLGYSVVGVARRGRATDLPAEVEVVEGDVTDTDSMRRLVDGVRPLELYHLAAAHNSSEASAAQDTRGRMLQVNFVSTQAIIDAIIDLAPGCRMLFAGSSQMHTPTTEVTEIDERTPYLPSSFYGVTKVAGAHLVQLMRRQRGLWGVTAVLFNHESSRRPPHFLSRKVTSYAARARHSRDGGDSLAPLRVQNLGACVDWSAATDVVRAMHLALQHDEPRDYVLASGIAHSVVQLLEAAFGYVGLDWRDHVEPSPASGLHSGSLVGNPQLAKRTLGWSALVSFKDLIADMVEQDLQLLPTRGS